MVNLQNRMRLQQSKIALFLFCVALFFVLNSCHRSDVCGRTGVIHDYLGQEGCTLVIQDTKGDLFVPENILDFGLTVYDGQKVAYSFQLSSNSTSCNIGVPVVLLCIDTNL